MRKIKIVADSSSDIFNLEKVAYSVAPLKIITKDREFTDNGTLDVAQMVDYLKEYKGKSSTSCPNYCDWLDTFGDAEEIFCVTVTGALSGSFNAAMMAKRTYEEQYPYKKVYVINTLSAGPETALIVEKLGEFVKADLSFEQICEKIESYNKQTRLLFMLESMRNLANNGRVSHLVAKMAGILGIRLIGKASDKGELEPISKCRGEKMALETIVENMTRLGFKGGKVHIAHCFNEKAAKELAEKIKSVCKDVKIKLYSCKGLCSFYVEKGGILIGFETA